MKMKINVGLISKISIAFCIVLIIYQCFFPFTTIYKSNNISNTKNVSASDIINSSNVYSQKFDCQNLSVDKIGLKLSTYMYLNNSGTLNVKIIDSSNNILNDVDLDLEEVNDNQIQYFEIGNNKCTNGKSFTIQFSYKDYKKNDSLAFWKIDNQNNNKAQINGEDTNYSILLEEYGKAKDYTFIWYLFLILLISFAMLSVSDGGKKSEIKK